MSSSSSFKNLKPIYFYMASVLSFVMANVIRDTSIELYYFSVVIALVLFILGFMKRMKAL